MNRFFSKSAFVFLAFMLTNIQLQAQFTTTFSKNVAPGQQSGFYYSLPQTMLQLDFIIEEIDCEPGPLVDFASQYYDMDEAIDYATTEYRMLDVKLSKLATPDPNATFFVSVSSGRGGSKAVFDILPNGIIRSIGSGNAMDVKEEMAVVGNEMQHPVCQSVQYSMPEFITLNSSGKTEAQLAREVADKIEEIRKAKFNLVSGYYETAHAPETFNQMFQKLEAMEEDYLSLFMGKRIKKTVERTVYVIPSKEVPTQTVAKFSQDEGLTTGTSGSGSPITVQTLPLHTTTAINAPSQSAVESMSHENKVFYRVPETASVRVSCNNKVLLEERFVVSQLGMLLMAPFSNTKMDFDTSTGQIINLRMQ